VRAFQQLIDIRKRWVVLGVGLVGMASAMALSTGATATTQHMVTQHVITNTVTKTSGFKLNFTVQQGQPTGYGGRYPNAVIINLNHTQGSATQANQYTFSKSVKFTGSSSFSSGHFQATFAKGRGSINMTFHPKGSVFTVHPPKGCKGSPAKARRGTLSGSFTLKADKLGTVKVSSIPATLSNANFNCNPTAQGVYIFQPPTAKTGINASLISGKAHLSIFTSTRGSGFDFLHTYSITGPASDYTFASNLSSATLTGSNGIKGNATFTGTNKVSNNKYTGTMSGSSFSVKMKSIGTVTPLPKPVKGYSQQRGKL
jgi:hypothetical protein